MTYEKDAMEEQYLLGNAKGDRHQMENEKIIIKKTGLKKHKTTKERLIEFYGANYDQNYMPQQEIDWGKPAGKEIG
jgi:hypothetical protein